MSWTERVYEAALRAGRPLLEAASALDGKLGRGIQGRRDAALRLARWAEVHRDPARPLFWLHAPSVGEALMAQAMIAALRASGPPAQFAFTYFSPSAVRVAERVGADVAGYLPWDLASETGRALDALRPSILAFVRTEIWPVLAREAQQRDVRLALVNAALAPGSSRLGPLARTLLRPAYARLDRIGAVAVDDAARFQALGVTRDRIDVTGDARFDQVLMRIEKLDRTSLAWERLAQGDPLVIAGSTWRADEERLIEAYTRVRERARARLALVPHEPTDAHIRRLERHLDASGLAHATLSAIDAGRRAATDVTIIDRVGILAELYAAACVAYVGGGFGNAGLHSVIEPAALGVPVLFGPRHGNAREAEELARAGGGFVVHDAAALAERITTLLADPEERRGAGGAAARFVTSKAGGAARNADLLLRLLSGDSWAPRAGGS